MPAVTYSGVRLRPRVTNATGSAPTNRVLAVGVPPGCSLPLTVAVLVALAVVLLRQWLVVELFPETSRSE
jgi:hypothetical protein